MEVEAGPARDAVGRDRRGQRADAAGRDSAAARPGRGTVLPEGRRRSKARAARRPTCANRATTRRGPTISCGRARDRLGGAGHQRRRRRPHHGRVRGRSAVRRRSGASWCRSSVRDRWTRTCSRTRPTASRVTCARRGIATPTPSTQRTPRDGGLAVVFTVRRGPQFRTARVTMAGRHRGARGRLARAAAHARRGAVRRGALVESDAATLAEQYRRRGFTQVRVEPVAGARRPATSSPVPVDVRLDRHRGPAHGHRRPSPSPGRQAVDEAALRAGDHLAHRSAVLPAAGRGRPRRHDARAAESRLPVGRRRRARDVHAGPVGAPTSRLSSPRARRSSSITCWLSAT